ncbi:MAG: class D sortase [Oscillospiraceae bacterium]|nr:class D sortase [Oscillospiraceae bacterium]
MAEHNSKKSPLLYFLTGIFLLILCIAVSVGVLIKPYEQLQTYLNLIFMDQSMKITPSSGVSGLVIQEKEIETAPPAEQQEFYENGQIIRPAFGEQYAVLKCDAISLSVPVYWGSSAELLERGACQASSSVLLGETGNVVIDAHVNTFFANLNQLNTGDSITLYTDYGIFTYEVSEKIQFLNTNKKYILPTVDDRLTLYTCEAQVLGTSDNRIGVTCSLVSKQFYQPAEEAST